MANETFISYARLDKEIIKRLFDALLKKGIDLWLDADDIRGAEVWMDSLLIAIQNCHNFIYCISENSIKSPYCQAELSHALRLNKRIIPVAIANVNPDSCSKPIRELQWLFLKDEGFKAFVDELTGIIEAPRGSSWGERLDSYLEIFYQGKCNKILELYRKSYVVGRGPEVDGDESGIITIRERRKPGQKPQTSRSHFRLQFKVGRWHIEDLSSNGTQVNGRLLRHYENRVLAKGDTIGIGAGIKFIYQEVHTADLKEEPDSRETAT